MSWEWRDEIRMVKKYIDDNACDLCYISDLCEIFDICLNKLSAWFKVAYGESPKNYLLNVKILKFKEMLRDDGDEYIAFYYAQKLGFQTESALYHLLKRKLGITFEEFIKKYSSD